MLCVLAKMDSLRAVFVAELPDRCIRTIRKEAEIAICIVDNSVVWFVEAVKRAFTGLNVRSFTDINTYTIKLITMSCCTSCVTLSDKILDRIGGQNA